jgi:hypothetical protein
VNHVSLLEVNVDIRVGVRGLEILQHYNFTVGVQFFAAAKGLLRQSIRRGCRKVQAHKRAVVWLCHAGLGVVNSGFLGYSVFSQPAICCGARSSFARNELL